MRTSLDTELGLLEILHSKGAEFVWKYYKYCQIDPSALRMSNGSWVIMTIFKEK